MLCNQEGGIFQCHSHFFSTPLLDDSLMSREGDKYPSTDDDINPFNNNNSGSPAPVASMNRVKEIYDPDALYWKGFLSPVEAINILDEIISLHIENKDKVNDLQNEAQIVGSP